MPKFKVGDMVRCIAGEHEGAGWQLGHEFKVIRIDEYRFAGGSVYWHGINGAGVFEDSLEKVNTNLWKGNSR